MLKSTPPMLIYVNKIRGDLLNSVYILLLLFYHKNLLMLIIVLTLCKHDI